MPLPPSRLKPNIAPVRRLEMQPARAAVARPQQAPQRQAAQVPAQPQQPPQEQIPFQEGRMPTGITGLDELIGGGLDPGSTTLVMGETGSGKTTMLAQFLYRGAVDNQDPAVLLSFDEPHESVYRHMSSYGYDFRALEEQGLFLAINYRPHEVKKLADEGGGLIWDSISSLGARRLAIDSLTSYAMLFENLYRAREAELLLFELLRKWGCTTMISAEGLYENKVDMATGIEYLCDGVIHLHHPRYQARRYRALEILKMRGTRHSEKLTPFEFVEGEGIRAYPNETVCYDIGKDTE